MSGSKTAFITGGASGIGLAIAKSLAAKGVNLIIVDQNISGLDSDFQELKAKHNIKFAAYKADVSSWEQQVSAWKEASDSGVRIDYVFPIAGVGEKPWVKNDPDSKEYDYEEPNLTTLDIDLKGVLYTSSLAIQHFRRQKPDNDGIKGRIITTASVCGFYCVPTLPIYTAAKHGVVGFTRSYGKHLQEEGILLNAICPNIVSTAISRPEFYAKVKDAGVLVPIENVIDVAMKLVDDTKQSGECFEVGPRGTRVAPPQAPMDEESKLSCDLLHERARPLHVAKT